MRGSYSPLLFHTVVIHASLLKWWQTFNYAKADQRICSRANDFPEYNLCEEHSQCLGCHSVVSNWLSEGLWDNRKVRTAVISSVRGAGDGFCFCSSQCRQAPEHTLAFSGCLCWFFSTYFVPAAPGCHQHFFTADLSPIHATSTLPRLPSSHLLRRGAIMKDESNRRSICIYITRVMCSELLWPGWAAWYQHDTSEIVCLSSRALIPRLISPEAWEEEEERKVLMQPVRSTLLDCSPQNKIEQTLSEKRFTFLLFSFLSLYSMNAWKLILVHYSR